MKVKTLALLMDFTVGCLATRQYAPCPDPMKENPEMARIYVIRPTLMGLMVRTEIRDGKQTIGFLGAKQYLCWERKPGKVVISGKSENESFLSLDLEKGHVYYIQQRMHFGFITIRNKLSLLTEKEGKEYMEKYSVH